MKVESIKCPNCGSSINQTCDRGFVICEYCGCQVKVDIEEDNRMLENKQFGDEAEEKIFADKNLQINELKLKEDAEWKEKHRLIVDIFEYAIIAIILIVLIWMFVRLFSLYLIFY